MPGHQQINHHSTICRPVFRRGCENSSMEKFYGKPKPLASHPLIHTGFLPPGRNDPLALLTTVAWGLSLLDSLQGGPQRPLYPYGHVHTKTTRGDKVPELSPWFMPTITMPVLLVMGQTDSRKVRGRGNHKASEILQGCGSMRSEAKTNLGLNLSWVCSHVSCVTPVNSINLLEAR